MSDFATIIEQRTVRLERLLPGPIERVWEYLTDSEKRGAWLAAGTMDLRLGGDVELYFHHADLSSINEPTPERFKTLENGHTSHGRITEFDPPRLLSFTWGEPNGSEVRFELVENQGEGLNGDAVRLVITHRRLANRSEMVGVAAGWDAHVGVLIACLKGGEPAPFWSAVIANQEIYENRFPKE